MDDVNPDPVLLAATGGAELPIRHVTVNAIVALNVGFFRKAAGLTQEELGERIGWGKTVVSTAERSWDAKRVRSFSADDLIAISAALRIPLAALLLPPEDDRIAFRYVLDTPGPLRDLGVRTLLSAVQPIGVFDADSPAMRAYRDRLAMTGVGNPDDIIDITKALEENLGEALRIAGAATHDKPLRNALVEHGGPILALVEQCEMLERRIEDLRAFERTYRQKLERYLLGQIRDLWAGEGAEQAVERLTAEAGENTENAWVSAVFLRADGTYDVRHSAGHMAAPEEPDDEGTP